MVNFTLFDHNWKKELKKKKRERNDGKGCDFREVITASLAIQGYCWYIRSLTVGESGSCLGSSPKGPMVGSVAQSAVTAEQGSAQGLRPCSWLTWALWHLHRPYHFRNLRTPSGKPWQLGWGGGRKGKTFFTWLSISSRWHLTSCVHLWPCSGMHLRSEDPLWQNSSLLFWKGGMVWLVFNSTVQEYPIQLCHIPEYEGRWENEVMTCSIFFFCKKKVKG